MNVVDTAGLRFTEDVIEKEGVYRAQRAAQQADLLLYIIDASKPKKDYKTVIKQWLFKKSHTIPIIIIENKIDLIGENPKEEIKEYPYIKLSIKTRAGIELLKNHLKKLLDWNILMRITLLHEDVIMMLLHERVPF